MLFLAIAGNKTRFLGQICDLNPISQTTAKAIKSAIALTMIHQTKTASDIYEQCLALTDLGRMTAIS